MDHSNAWFGAPRVASIYRAQVAIFTVFHFLVRNLKVTVFWQICTSLAVSADLRVFAMLTVSTIVQLTVICLSSSSVLAILDRIHNVGCSGDILTDLAVSIVLATLIVVSHFDSFGHFNHYFCLSIF